MADRTPDNNHEKVLQELGVFVTETKVLIEKVMTMRVQCVDAQKTLLKLFYPKCINIIDISNELSLRSNKQANRNKRIKIKRLNATKMDNVRILPVLETIDLSSENNS